MKLWAKFLCSVVFHFYDSMLNETCSPKETMFLTTIMYGHRRKGAMLPMLYLVKKTKDEQIDEFNEE